MSNVKSTVKQLFVGARSIWRRNRLNIVRRQGGSVYQDWRYRVK